MVSARIVSARPTSPACAVPRQHQGRIDPPPQSNPILPLLPHQPPNCLLPRPHPLPQPAGQSSTSPMALTPPSCQTWRSSRTDGRIPLRPSSLPSCIPLQVRLWTQIRWRTTASCPRRGLLPPRRAHAAPTQSHSRITVARAASAPQIEEENPLRERAHVIAARSPLPSLSLLTTVREDVGSSPLFTTGIHPTTAASILLRYKHARARHHTRAQG